MVFGLTHVRSANMEAVYDLYCSEPLGGDHVVLASLFGGAALSFVFIY